jgi:AcrR family transcriptional regulator
MTIMEKLGLLTDFEKTILDKARIIFEKKGYYETSIEEIAQSLSIGKGTIYRHFGNKLMLFFSVVLNIFEDSKNVIEKIDAGAAFENKLDFFIDQMVKMTMVSGKFIRSFLEEHLFLLKDTYHHKNIEEPYGYYLKAREFFVLSLSGIIEQGKKDGKIMGEVEPVMTAQLTIMAIFNYFKESSFSVKKTKDALSIETLKRYLYRAIGYNRFRSFQ